MFWFDFSWQIQSILNTWWWPLNFLLIAGLVLLGYVGYKKPAWAVAATIVALPTYLIRSKISFLPLTYLELCIWITFGSWLIYSARQKNFFLDQARQYRIPIMILVLAATIGVLISLIKVNASGLWKAYFIEPILFFIVVSSVARESKNRDVLLWSLGASTLAISLLAIYQKFSGFGIFEPAWVGPTHRRVTSLFTSPNAVGLFLGPIIALYCGWLVADFKKLGPTMAKLGVIFLSLIAITFTGSVGTWLGLGAALIFLAYFGWNKKMTAAIVLAAIILCLILPIARHQLIDIVLLRNSSIGNRLALWQMATTYLTQSPLHFIFGAGILGFAQIQNALRDPLILEPLLYPHNIILNFWLETGLLGLVALIGILIKFFQTGFTKKSAPPWLTLGIMAAMITILVHGLIDVPYFKNDLAVLFWIIIGLL